MEMKSQSTSTHGLKKSHRVEERGQRGTLVPDYLYTAPPQGSVSAILTEGFVSLKYLCIPDRRCMEHDIFEKKADYGKKLKEWFHFIICLPLMVPPVPTAQLNASILPAVLDRNHKHNDNRIEKENKQTK